MAGAPAIAEAVERMLSDESYAKEVREHGQALLNESASADAAQQYFQHFGLDPEAAAGMTNVQAAASCTCNSNTVITLTSITTPICGTCCAATMTTTTSG